jgi:hypothetical protein
MTLQSDYQYSGFQAQVIKIKLINFCPYFLPCFRKGGNCVREMGDDERVARSGMCREKNKVKEEFRAEFIKPAFVLQLC